MTINYAHSSAQHVTNFPTSARFLCWIIPARINSQTGPFNSLSSPAWLLMTGWGMRCFRKSRRLLTLLRLFSGLLLKWFVSYALHWNREWLCKRVLFTHLEVTKWNEPSMGSGGGLWSQSVFVQKALLRRHLPLSCSFIEWFSAPYFLFGNHRMLYEARSSIAWSVRLVFSIKAVLSGWNLWEVSGETSWQRV